MSNYSIASYGKWIMKLMEIFKENYCNEKFKTELLIELSKKTGNNNLGTICTEVIDFLKMSQ